MFFHTFLPSNSHPEAGKGWVVGGYRVLLIIPSKYSIGRSVGSSAVKKLNATVLFSNFLSNNSGILPILPSSESLRLDLSFLKIFNRGSL